MKIIQLKPGSIKPYEKNPRHHPPEQVEALANIIGKYGFLQPILIDANSVIVAGHGRYLAAQKLGLTSIPCVRAEHLSEQELRKFRILDNRLPEMSEWDLDMLAEEIQAMYDHIELDDLGFSDKEINKFLNIGVPKEKTDSRVTKAVKKKFGQWKPSKEDLVEFKGREVVVEFSGGKDSSAAALWCKRWLPDNPITLLYCDMGADHVGFSLHLRAFSQQIDLPLKIFRTEKGVIELILETGKWPFWQGSYCQIYMYEALDAVMPKNAIVVRGGRAQEKGAKSKVQESRWRAHPRREDLKIYSPLYFAEKGTGEALLENSDMPVWEGYERGLQRTACRICPGQKPVTYAVLRRKYPDVWQELIDLEAILGPGAWQGTHIKGRKRGEIATFSQLADLGEERLNKT